MKLKRANAAAIIVCSGVITLKGFLFFPSEREDLCFSRWEILCYVGCILSRSYKTIYVVWLEIYIEFWKSDLKTQLGPWWHSKTGPFKKLTLQRDPFRENNEAPSIAPSRTHTANTTKKTKMRSLLAHNKIVFKEIFCYCFIIFSSLDNDRVPEYWKFWALTNISSWCMV